MVADGRNLWFYDRDLEQVSVKAATTALTATPAGLLSGDGNIRELFTVAPAGKKDGFDWVLVTPRESDADFREARLAFGTGLRKEGELKRMVLKDKLGQTVRLDFSNSERNAPVAEAEMKFTPPESADVIGTPVP
jgi:outer membrane lipoprotein-sorting protein